MLLCPTLWDMVNWRQIAEKSASGSIDLTIKLGTILWAALSTGMRLLLSGLIHGGRFVERHSGFVHEWASTGRHARGNINHNSENMIRHARNMISPFDKIGSVGGVALLAFFNPVAAIVFGAACYVLFFQNADSLTGTSTIMGWLETSVSTTLGVMLFAASLCTSNKWRKAQFDTERRWERK